MAYTISTSGVATRRFGRFGDDAEVVAITLSNRKGLAVTILSLGATIQSVVMADRNGGSADIALGFDSVEGYLDSRDYVGGTIGRYAGRIAGSSYVIDGVRHHAAANDGTHALHGGLVGFDKRLWQIVSTATGAAPSLVLRLVSADGDEGYPGNVTVDARFAVDEANRLTIDYRATTDRATIINLTNHTYWNLAPDEPGEAMRTRLHIPATRFLPVDTSGIPTGEMRSVAGTAFDFTQYRAIATGLRDGTDSQIRAARGYDHDWVFADAVGTRAVTQAVAIDPGSGRRLELASNQPALHLYTGNFLDGTTVGKGGRVLRQGDGFALEPQCFPDSPNRTTFPNVMLRPGETYRNTLIYRFISDEPELPGTAASKA